MTKPNPVVHFEMPATDLSRAKKFYEEVFNWNMNQLGEEMGNYLLAGTVEVDEKMMPKEPGAINGGFWETKEKDYPHLVVSVDNLKEHMEKFQNAGGKILGKIMPIPDVGDFVMAEDPEGNKIGMLQPTSPQ